MSLPDPALWKRLSPLLDELLELPREQRAARVDAIERDDPALAAALRPLVAAAADATEQAFLAGQAGTPFGADAATRGGASPDALVGLHLGAYTLVSPLGQGGAGSVWRARRSDGRYEGEAAVKLLHLSLLGHAAAERFRREGAILSRLQHPHIAALLDAGVAAGGQPYLVLELVQGEPIDVYCRRLRLDVEARLLLFLDVLAAVGHAHRHLVVHRDLKPANVLVSADGQVKLLDFGIAKLLADEHAAAGATALTQEGGRALTPAYAAPEQFERGDLGDISTATDVYALGVVLYELLGGRHPTSPGGGNLFDVIRATQQQEPRRLSRAPTLPGAPGTETPEALAQARATTLPRLTRRLAGDLDNILARMLRKAPAERYATVDAVADDIRRHLAHEPVTARPDSWRYRAVKFMRRNRGAVAATALTTLAIVAGIVATVSQAHRAQQQATIAQAERDRALKELTYAEAANALVAFLLNEGWGRTGTVADLLARADALVAAEFADDAELRARMQLMLTMLYSDAGADKRADALLALAKASAGQVGNNPSLQAELQCTEAYLASERWDLARSRALFDRAVATLRQAGAPAGAALADCLTHRSVVERQRGAASAAASDAAEALALLARPRPGQRRQVIDARLAQADAQAALGDTRTAVQAYDQVLADMEATGRGRSQMAAIVWNNLAVRLARAGQALAAARALDRQAEIERDMLGDDNFNATSRLNHALLLARVGERDRARTLLADAQARVMQQSNPRTQGLVLGNGAGFWCDDGDVPRCAAQAARAESILEPLLPPKNQGRVQLIDNRAKLAGLRGDLAGAYALRQQAVALSSANGVRTAERSGGLSNLAEAALALGRIQEAAEHAAQAETIARAGLSGFPSSLYLARALLSQSRVRAAQGDAEGARAKATEALAQAQSSAGDKAPVALEAAALLQRLAR